MSRSRRGDVRAGRLDDAISALRTALAYLPDNFEYRLKLAEALAAAGHTRQAQAYLRALWDEEPGNGTVNLELARLAASADIADVLRFYHGAIYGVWQDNPRSGGAKPASSWSIFCWHSARFSRRSRN